MREHTLKKTVLKHFNYKKHLNIAKRINSSQTFPPIPLLL